MRDLNFLSRRDVLRMAGAAGGLAVANVGGLMAQSARKIESLAPELDRVIATSEPIRELATGMVALPVQPKGRSGGRKAAISSSTTFTLRDG